MSWVEIELITTHDAVRKVWRQINHLNHYATRPVRLAINKVKCIEVHTLFAWCVDPGEMGEVRVGGSCDHLTSDLAEIVRALRERDDFGGAYERAATKKHRFSSDVFK